MDKKKNMAELVKELTRENEELKKYIGTLLEQLDAYRDLGDKWIHAKIYKDAIKDAKEAKLKYDEALKEIAKIKIEYKKKLDELIESYK